MSEQYRVGFKRPPEGTRFKAGISGNPTGRPKAQKTLATELAGELEEIVDFNERGQHKKITKARAIAKVLVRLATQGDLRAANVVASFCARTTTISDESDAPTAEDEEIVRSFLAREGKRRGQKPSNKI